MTSSSRRAALALAVLLLALPVSGTVCLAACPVDAGTPAAVEERRDTHCHEDAAPAGDGIGAAGAGCVNHQSPALQVRDALRPPRAEAGTAISALATAAILHGALDQHSVQRPAASLSVPPLVRPAAPLVLRL